MPNWFISHATEDRPFIQGSLVPLLDAFGIQHWWSAQEIATAEQWERAIRSALNSCEWFILVMSPTSARSEWVRAELAWALKHRPDRVLPIMIAPCDPVDFYVLLPSIQYLDYTGDLEVARNQLIKVLVGAIGTNRRTAAVNATWSGRARQHKGPKGTPLNYRIELTLRAKGPRITGEMVVFNPLPDGPDKLSFDCSGELFHDRFVHLNYVTKDNATVQFGSLILQLDDRATSLEGQFIGYGAWSRAIVSGDFELEKVAGPAEHRDRVQDAHPDPVFSADRLGPSAVSGAES